MKKNSQTLHFARPRILLVGCGDIGMRMLPWLTRRFRVYALVRDPAHLPALRAAGAQPVLADLDQAASLRRVVHLAPNVIHLAPPPAGGTQDLRTRHLCAILPAHTRVVYVSTSGVYGDCGGALVTETRPVAPFNLRAVRRVDAEQILRAWARKNEGDLTIVRVPGIYAAGRLPVARLEKRIPALLAEEDVYTNHIHAEDLARILCLALFRGRSQRVYHAVDGSEMKMGEYFDLVADSFKLERPPRLPRVELVNQVSPAMLSFMGESRRLCNRRLQQELKIRLRYPDVEAGLFDAKKQQNSP